MRAMDGPWESRAFQASDSRGSIAFGHVFIEPRLPGGRTSPGSKKKGKVIMSQKVRPYKPKNPVRVVTAASLFDGHDAAINIIRRILQGTGVEVIHLGHNRAVAEIVDAAIQEDAHAVGVSCYQGGHVEFFKYMVDLLREHGCGHIKVFGGGGGVIVPEEIAELEDYGVAKIYSPEDGRRLGLQGIINHFVESIDYPLGEDQGPELLDSLSPKDPFTVARAITLVERAALGQGGDIKAWREGLEERLKKSAAPVVGITGTGGSGKSSLTDEVLLRFLQDFPDKTVAVLSVDPTRRKSGGALLGDRIRMNSLLSNRIYLRSLATRGSGMEVSRGLGDVIMAAKAAGYDLVIVETAGIGQGDAAVVDLVDVSLYVMTSDFGAASQLEKIDMLDFADLVAINKYDRRGAEDASGTCASRCSATRWPGTPRPTTCRSTAPSPASSTTTAPPPCTSALLKARSRSAPG